MRKAIFLCFTVLLICVLLSLPAMGVHAEAAALAGSPGAADLKAIGSGIEYPREDEYYDAYLYATVNAPGGHSVFGFGSADHLGSRYTVLDGEEVVMLAERKGYACCIVLSQDKARWISLDHLLIRETAVHDSLPFEEYGQLTDVNDPDRLRRRAEWFYRTYICDPEKEGLGAQTFSAESFVNDIRLINGIFMRDSSGEIFYGDWDVIGVANDLHTIANHDSLAQYGNQIFYTPMAPLFSDGSPAQQGAVALDVAMRDVVSAIRAEDNDRFLTAAENWGRLVAGMFCYDADTDSIVKIREIPAPESFFLYHAMSSKYASTILEYAEAHNLEVSVALGRDRNRWETLAQIVGDLNDRPLSPSERQTPNPEAYGVAQPSLPEDLCMLAKDYYQSRLDQ